MNPMNQYPPRPTMTDEILEPVVVAFIATNPEFAKRCGPDSVQDIVDAYSLSADGFELCKYLERDHGWDTSREDMDTLDELGSDVRARLKQLEQEWMTHNNIKPPYPIGTKVKCNSRRDIGFIDSICEYHPGRFLVRPEAPSDVDRKHSMRWVCKFEEVEPVSEASA
ncbi:hypothetical protein [Marinobacterium stanieri]|uniref:Uncharacterized protein n=1 Tax=Marinobacterium stanieri TaxID=49186 RepID=A0A1N6QD21_9GAMM|nr:hypothetical protein [Marinobacterium stanieri]SIQ14511.1 hypothetical protein SAMN05421647_102428 [Marinobacterium stanieri]